jgi:asparagine synthetase B (glutamine-hydrolysing)
MFINKFSATWCASKPTFFDLSEVQTHCNQLQLGGGVKIDINGVALNLVGTRRRVFIHQTKPGAYSLYFGIHNDKLVVDTYALLVKAKLPLKTKIVQVQPGVLYVFDGKQLRLFKGEPERIPTIQTHLTLEKAGERLYQTLCAATEDMYNRIGRPTVVTTLSAGTDSVLVTLALREIKATFHAVCVGDEKKDFDPLWAKKYAIQLGIPLLVIPLPPTDALLTDLLTHTIRTIEMSDMSNVMMGMCSTMIRILAKELGCEYVFHGHFADDIIGNEIITTGGYNKRCKGSGIEPCSESWRDERYMDCTKINPNDSQIDKVSRANFMSWRTPFYHPEVIDFLLSCPINLFSFAHKKPIYYAALKGKITYPAWESHHKVGYYTGSGIGLLRRNNPILGDLNMRAILKSIKGTV